MTPSFSIIIPVYNVALYLRASLDSVLSQACTDWEAICVDDGSTDGSGSILDEYAAKDIRFRAVHQKNAGVGASRNKAIKEASGDWLLFLDADDVLLSDALDRLMDVIEGKGNGVDAFFFKDVKEFTGSCGGTKSECSGELLYASPSAEDGRAILFHKPYLRGLSQMRVLRTEVFRNVKYPENWPMMEDSIHLMDILRIKARWAIVDLIFYGYRLRDGSASRTVPAERPLQVMRSVNSSLMKAKEYFLLRRREIAEISHRFDSAMMYFLSVAFANPTKYNMAGLMAECKAFYDITGRGLPNWSLRAKENLFRGTRSSFGFRAIDLINRAIYGVRNRLGKLLGR